MDEKKCLLLASVLSLLIITAGVSAAQPILPDKFYGTVKLGGMDAPAGTKIDIKLLDNYLKTYELESAGTYTLYIAEGNIGNPIEFLIKGMPVGRSVRTGGLRKNLNLSLSATSFLTQNLTSQNRTINFDGKNTVFIDMKITTKTDVVNEGISVSLYDDSALTGFSIGDGKSHIKSITVYINPSIVDHAILKIYYTDDDVRNFIEGSLMVYLYNEIAGDWEAVPAQGINTEGNYVWANVTHFSSYGLFGKELVCGDGICSSGIGESCSSCPGDCGTCPSGGGGGGPPITCEEKWVCSEWSECSSEGIQKRICADEKRCGTFDKKPSESQSCEIGIQITPLTPIELTCGNGLCDNGETCKRCPKDCGECSIPVSEAKGFDLIGFFAGLQGSWVFGIITVIILALVVMLFLAARRKR